MLIVGDTTGDGETSYWELAFIDPHTTRQAPAGRGSDGPSPRCDWITAIAYRCESGVETGISGPRPQGHRLLLHMADRSRGSVAVACGHEELIRALRGDRDEWPVHRAYNHGDLAGVVVAVRRRIESQSSEPKVLETTTGIGYRLRVRAEPEAR